MLKLEGAVVLKEALFVSLALVCASSLVACGREARKKEDVKPSPQAADSAAGPAKTQPVQPAPQAGVNGPAGVTNPAPVTPVAAATNTPATTPSQQPITAGSESQVNSLIKLLSSNTGTNQTSLPAMILGGSDPKLIAALTTCPGTLLLGNNTAGLLSALTGLVSGQKTATNTQAAATVAPTTTQITAVASCLFNALK